MYTQYMDMRRSSSLHYFQEGHIFYPGDNFTKKAINRCTLLSKNNTFWIELKCKWIDLYTVISSVRCNYRSGAALHSGIQCSLSVLCPPQGSHIFHPDLMALCWLTSILQKEGRGEEKRAVMNRILSVWHKGRNVSLAYGPTRILSSNYH